MEDETKRSPRPLTFGATMLATALGIVVVSVISAIMMIVWMVQMVLSLDRLDKKDTAVVRPGTFLTVDLGRIGGDRTADGLMASLGESKTIGLIDAVHAIGAAADDDRICGLLLKDPATSTLAWGSLKELRDAVAGFGASGKPVVAYATGYSQGGYYVATAAEKVCLHPSGMVDFRGIGAQVMYYKDLLEKLGVQMQLIRPESCAYKSAGEVYTLDHMSAANREQIRAYIGSIWQTATAEMSASRGMSSKQMNTVADNLSGYLAADALASSLVDTLCFEDDMRQMLAADYGAQQTLAIQKYALTIQPSKGKDRIAVIYAQGDVVDGSSRGVVDAVYGDDIVRSLNRAAADDKVKAIVMRVNSPGGQATASESMTHAVMAAREKKPVVVSMGDMAASAGYEMSCMADYIVAQPTTITGSIGVFGTVPDLSRLMRQKLGIGVDTVQTNEGSTALGVMRALSPTAMAMMTRNVEDFYKVFVGRVAEGRGMTFEQVHAIARGRVWTGADALGIGLVDTLGGFDVALEVAARLAGMDDSYGVVCYPEKKDTWTQLSEMFGDGSSDDDISLVDKARIALRWRLCGDEQRNRLANATLRMEQDLRYIATHDGVHARLPFVVIAE